jgi:hypothetical protein
MLIISLCLINISIESSSPSNVKKCLCSHDNSNCWSSFENPDNVLTHLDFQTMAKKDKYGKTYLREKELNNSFGMNNSGYSIIFNPDSYLSVFSLEKFKSEGFGSCIWLKFKEIPSSSFASLLKIKFNQLNKNSESIYNIFLELNHRCFN